MERPYQETLEKIYFPPWQVLSNAVRVSKLRTHLAVCGGVEYVCVCKGGSNYIKHYSTLSSGCLDIV